MATVNISDIALTVETGDDKEVKEDEEVRFSGSIVDPGNDTRSIVGDFGDGTRAPGDDVKVPRE